MCFSASASFTVSALLGLISIATLRKAKNNAQRAFATIPLLFALQQFAEGFVWLSFSYQALEFIRIPASYIFLSFALIIWPLYTSFSMYLLEHSILRKKLLLLPLGAGIIIASSFLITFLCCGLATTIFDNHIFYYLYMPKNILIPASFLYLIATLAPFFISSIPLMWFFGVLLALAYLISLIFYYKVLISVWCFFAAILSTFVFILLE